MASVDARRAAIEDVLALATELGRDDLAHRLRVAIVRMGRPATVVCVVGEFKQGKSSLVNALLGQPLCPVDDDLATSVITLVRHGPEATVEVRRREGEITVTEPIPLGDLRSWVTEEGNRGNQAGLERVDIMTPAPLLADGLVLVDTPGMGGLGAGQAAATLAFLPFADGLILVTDAGAELSGPEAELLERASAACPTILVALSKVDLHPHWERIADIDRSHLQALGTAAPVLPVSATLRTEAIARHDPDLQRYSGIDRLVTELEDGVIGPAKALAASRATVEAFGVLDQLAAGVQGELEVLFDVASSEASTEAFARARDRLDHLRGPAARWNVLVGDRIADLNNDVSHRFRGAMRTTMRTIEDEIELLKTAEDWDALARRLQSMVAEGVADAFTRIEQGAAAVRQEVAELLAEETLDLPPLPQRDTATDPRALWIAKQIDPETGRLTSTLTGLRGAQSGILLFGMMSSFLPGGIAAFLALCPITLGIGAAFAGVQLLDAHKRKVQQRRGAARANLRQFLDDVQFEVGDELGQALRDVQRSMRDDFTQRIGELQRTYAELCQQAQQAASTSEAERDTRVPVARELLARMDQAHAAVEAAG